jgi:hypothetical protein
MIYPPVQFKKIDLIVQLVLIALALVFAFNVGGFNFLYSYFVVGGCQVLSTVLNLAILRKEYRSQGRIFYEVSLLALGFWTLAAYFDRTSIDALLMFLLYGSPVMALWYFIMTYTELQKVTTAAKQQADLRAINEPDEGYIQS